MVKRLAGVVAPLMLMAGCAQADSLLFHGAFTDAHARAVNARTYRADVAACGRGPGAEWCLAAADDRNLARLYPPQVIRTRPPAGVVVYDQSQCAGTFANGRCQGRPQPRTSLQPVCHDQIIDGRCSGPIF